jgi:Sec-independent protein translocase protein TatA
MEPLGENAQAIAGLIALVSVAIFTVEAMILPRVWGKLDTCFFGIPVERKRYLSKFVFIMTAIIIFLLGVYTVAGIYDPQNVEEYSFMAMVIVVLVFVFVIIVRGLIWLMKRLISWIKSMKKESGEKNAAEKRKESEELPLLFVMDKESEGRDTTDKKKKIDELPLFFVTGSVFLIIGMFCDLFALFGVSATMLDINIGIYNTENYHWGVWLMMDAIFFFVIAAAAVGSGYLYEKWRL